MRSPKWNNPAYNLPPIKSKEAARGKDLYLEHCQSCHKVFDREKDQVRKVGIVLSGFEHQAPGTAGFERPKPTDRPEVSIGTDPAMARNFVDHTFALEEGEQLVHAKDLVATALRKIWFKSFFRALLYGVIEELFNNCSSRVTDDLEVYKARPLNGIWATGPYLHNGSVPSVMELLKPVDERVKIFCVGSREFDEVNLGFESELDAAGECGDNFKFDTSIEGNSNAGHDSYGPLTEQERLDIIEFIKSE